MADIIEREQVTTSPVVVVERGGGGAGSVVAVILGLLIVGVILYFAVFGGMRALGGALNGRTNVTIEQPQQPAAPKVEINNPKVEVKIPSN
jgi:hypothetical protein